MQLLNMDVQCSVIAPVNNAWYKFKLIKEMHTCVNIQSNILSFPGGPLHLGDIEVLPDRSLCVRCPWHSWRFNLENGKVCHPKGRDVTAVVYPTKVREDGTILVGFEEFSPSYFNGNGDF